MLDVYFEDELLNKRFIISNEDSLETIESSIKWCVDNEFPYELNIPEFIDSFSYRDRVVYQEIYDDLSRKYSSELKKLIAYSVWVIWYSCQRKSKLFQIAIKENWYRDDGFGDALAKAEGVGEILGYTRTALDEIHGETLGISKIQNFFSFEKLPSDIDTLRALYLWFMASADKKPITEFSKDICLYEAKAAQAFAFGIEMRDYAQKIIGSENVDSLAEARKKLAKQAADARHSSNREVRKMIVEKYKEEKEKYSSKDAAAMAFTKDYPYEFSTLRSWLRNA